MVNLGEVFEIIPGRHLLETNHNRESNGIPYLTGPSDFGELKAVATRWTEKPDVMCRPLDVLVTVKGAGVGKINFAPDEPACIGRQLMAVRARPNLSNSEFAFWIIRSRQDLLKSQAMGATVPGLAYEHLERLQIPLPPLAEQRRIAGRLREQMAEVARARAAVQTQLDAAQALPAALLRAHFTTPAAQHWTRRSLNDLCHISTGTTPSRARKEFFGKGIPWVTPGDYDGSIYISRGRESVTDVGISEGRARVFPKGAVLLVCIGATIGKVAIGANPISANQQINALICGENLLPEFLYFHLRFDRADFIAASASATLPIINQTRLGARSIPLPPLAEQRALAVRLAAEMSAATALRASLQTRRSEIERLPAALLRTAFNATPAVV